MNAATKTKIKDWFIITRIRILNFIKEHKYVSAFIGVLLLSVVIAFIVRAATNETIDKISVSITGADRGISVVTESDSGNNKEAPNFSKVIYSLKYYLGEGDSRCQNNDVVYKVDEVVIDATIPYNENIKWIGSDETAVSNITQNNENKTSTLSITVPSVNVCSANVQTFSLMVLNADKNTNIKPTITIKGGSNATESETSAVQNIDSINTTYDETKKDYSLIPILKPGIAKKGSEDSIRDVRFGIILGIKANSNEETISLKNSHLDTSALITLLATQGIDSESIELYETNKNLFNNDKNNGNYFGINTSSKHYFSNDIMPDLSNTSGKIESLVKLSSKDATIGRKDGETKAPIVTLSGDYDVEIEKYPDSYSGTFRSDNLDSGTKLSYKDGTIIKNYEETSYKDDTKLDSNEIPLNKMGNYKIIYKVIGSDSSTSMVKNVKVVSPQNENYTLNGPKTVYILKDSNYKESGLYKNESLSNAKKDIDYTIKYIDSSNEELSNTDLIKTVGEYKAIYTLTDTSETITRNIKVVDELPSITSDEISVDTGNIYPNEKFDDIGLKVNGKNKKCEKECSVIDSNEKLITYEIDKSKDGYIIEIKRNLNIIPFQYNLSISGIMPNVTVDKIKDSDGFYAIGAYYVTTKSVRKNTDPEKFDVNLKAILNDKESTATSQNKVYASGYENTALSNNLYVKEDSESKLVDSSEKKGMNGNYYTASMGEEIILDSNFEYGYDADENIQELKIEIPVSGNLIPTAYSSEVSDKSSYFYYQIKYDGKIINEIPNYSIKYIDSNGKMINPEEFNESDETISYIQISLKPNDDKSFEIKPGTLIQIKTKYKVRTYSGTSEEAKNLNDLKFNLDAIFSWTGNGSDYSKNQSTPYVYITPYKIRTNVGIGSNKHFSTSDSISLDASKNENYTIYAKTDIVSPAMNINTSIFGYNRISNVPIVFELPEGVNYVYNKDYNLNPEVTYDGSKTILTYNYLNAEPNSWIEPIYFDFNVDVEKITSSTNDFSIIIKVGNLSTTDFSINNDVSSIDKYKLMKKNVSIANTEKVSYGQYIYSNNKYVSNIDKDENFDFVTKLHNNSDTVINNLNVYTVLPYLDTEKESAFNGTYEIENLPENAYCTTSSASMVTKGELVDKVNWQPCSDFKSKTGRYSGFNAFKIVYDKLLANESKVNTIKIYTKDNKPGDLYTFKSYLQYSGSDYKSFKDINLQIVSKKINGVVWEDFNTDGIMDESESKVSDIMLKLYNDKDELLETTIPNKNGEYEFSELDVGMYYIVAEFNIEKYGITGQPSEDFYDKTRLSVFKSEKIKGEDGNEDINVVKTDLITIGNETRVVNNVNLGLSLRKVFKLKIDKYITRTEVTNALGVVTKKDYGSVKLAKLDVKNINNVNIKVIYTLKIQNVKYYPGYASLITEQIPEGMSFNPNYLENKGWELSDDGVLENRTLSNELIDENESKYLTIAFDITSKEAGSFINYASIDELNILGGKEDEK